MFVSKRNQPFLFLSTKAPRIYCKVLMIRHETRLGRHLKCQNFYFVVTKIIFLKYIHCIVLFERQKNSLFEERIFLKEFSFLRPTGRESLCLLLHVIRRTHIYAFKIYFQNFLARIKSFAVLLDTQLADLYMKYVCMGMNTVSSRLTLQASIL